MIKTIQTAVSGLLSAQNRVAIAADNIANANSTSPRGAASAYAPKRAVSSPTAGGGVVTRGEPIRPAQVPVYAPDSPDADGEGFVGLPNVSLAEELVQMKVATNTYKANAAVIRRAGEMMDTLLENEREA